MTSKVLSRPFSKKAGFTMIELLIVLALLGAVSTIVVPQLWGQYTRFSQQQQVERFWAEVKKHAADLRRHGESFVFEKDNQNWQQLAQKYSLVLESSDVIIMREDGFTSGGSINLKVEDDERLWRIVISTPDGVVKIEPK